MDSPKEKSCLSNLTGFCDIITHWVGEGTAVNDVYLDPSKATNRYCSIGHCYMLSSSEDDLSRSLPIPANL